MNDETTRILDPELHEARQGIDIGEENSLVSVESQYGNAIRWYDDGWGTLWVYREADGFRGLVRAVGYEDAWQTVVDEILDDAEPEAELSWDGVYARGGVPSGYNLKSILAQSCLNGSYLEELTPELMSELKWKIRHTTGEES
jgi:hypothetical protein